MLSKPQGTGALWQEMFMVQDALGRFEASAYVNETVIACLSSERDRLKQAIADGEQALADWQAEQIAGKERAKQDRINTIISKMNKADRERALDLQAKLAAITLNDPLHDDFEIDLNRLIQFYQSGYGDRI